MQRSFMYVAAVALLGWGAASMQAQTAPAASQPSASPKQRMLAPGTVIGAELSKGINAKKAKVGQEVVAKSLGDLRDTSGNVVIPRGAKLVGHVTAAQAASKQEPQSSLGILFDKAEVKHGQEVGLHASIQALAKPQPSPAMEQGGGPMEGPEGGAPMGGGQPGMSPGRPGGNMPGASSGRQPGEPGGNMGGPMNQPGGNGGAPTINANSHGVIGIPNLTLSPQASPTEGSVLKSSHGNVKLDSGTLLVLRVIGQ